MQEAEEIRGEVRVSKSRRHGERHLANCDVLGAREIGLHLKVRVQIFIHIS